MGRVMPQLKPVTIDSTYGQPDSQTVSIILSAIHLAVGELGQSHSRIIADPHNVCLNRLVTSFQLILAAAEATAAAAAK